MSEIKELKQKNNNANTIIISYKLLSSQKVAEISLFIKEQVSVLELKEFLSKDFDFPVENIILFNPLEGILDNIYQFSFKENNIIKLELILQNNDNNIILNQNDIKSESKKSITDISNKINNNLKINNKNNNENNKNNKNNKNKIINFQINKNNPEIQKNNNSNNLINKNKETSYPEAGKMLKNVNFKTQQINSDNKKASKINFFTNNIQNKMILPKINESFVNNNFNDATIKKLDSKKVNNNNLLGQKRKIIPSFVTTITNHDKTISLDNNN